MMYDLLPMSIYLVLSRTMIHNDYHFLFQSRHHPRIALSPIDWDPKVSVSSFMP